MTEADFSPLPPELGPVAIDPRSIHAFWHGFPSPLIRWHMHHEYELHLIVSSSGRVFIGDHVGDFSPGQLILTGPYLPHNWINQAPAGEVVDRRDGVIQFRQDLVQSIASSAPEFKKLLPLLDRARCGIEFHPNLCLEAEKWFDDIINSEGLRRMGLLFEILERLSQERDYRMLSNAIPKAQKRGELVAKLEFAINYIDKHHAADIHIESVARPLGMSSSSFSRFFSKTTGSNFTHFLNIVRISHACELLSSTDRPITEICYTAGFKNVANFNRRFRELKHITPTEYRKSTKIGHC